jgi:hypothetical protein
MVFLFVGSSGLTEASFPPDLAIPQLPCSSVYAILLPMKDSPTAVFPHEGTSTLPVHAHVRRTKTVQPTADGALSSASRAEPGIGGG